MFSLKCQTWVETRPEPSRTGRDSMPSSARARPTVDSEYRFVTTLKSDAGYVQGMPPSEFRGPGAKPIPEWMLLKAEAEVKDARPDPKRVKALTEKFKAESADLLGG